jgi:hypothetical protein
MAAVEPPDVHYKFSLPSGVINRGLLSRPQLETVAYACQSHDQKLPGGLVRKGFFLGDGAGVGKGRQIAGIMYENFLKGRKKSVWVSISKDLQYDARRDLDEVGAKMIESITLEKQTYGSKIACKEGVLFVTYSLLIG